VRLNIFRPMCWPAPVEVLRTLIADLPLLSAIASDPNLLTTLEGICCAADRAASALALLLNQSNGWKMRLFPSLCRCSLQVRR